MFVGSEASFTSKSTVLVTSLLIGQLNDKQLELNWQTKQFTYWTTCRRYKSRTGQLSTCWSMDWRQLTQLL